MGKLLAERAVLKHRLGMLFNINKEGELKGWINTVRDDSRLEAGGIPQATNTGRYRHSGVVNVPKASPDVPYGEHLRALFIAREGYKLMGVDAKGLEARMEAHYTYPMPGGVEYAYAKELLEGDIHTKNAVFFETDRNGAKAPKYALTYGCQPSKLAETLGCSVAKAKKYYEAFWNGNVALKALKTRAEQAYRQRGFLIGLDGRKLLIRSEHALVNTLFQSAGSIVVKTATAYMANWIRDRGLDARQVLHMHDEFTYEFHPDHEEEICELARQAFKKAGEFWKLNVPIEGDPKVGTNWKEIH